MAVIAKAHITLVSISDAYSVSLQPSNITINADAYGNNPKLTNAYTIISLYCADVQVPIVKCELTNSSLWSNGVPSSLPDCQLTKSGDSIRLDILNVDKELDGWREVKITTNTGQQITARFSYTIVRETSMLDWILEWNKNYTEISGDHVATPNAFIGNKSAEGVLSGVYIGADMPNHPVGIYAVKDCPPLSFTQGNINDYEIFHLNENGGVIGGWNIISDGLIRENDKGRLELLSEGTIRYVDLNNANKPFWELNSSGAGSLAKGHITWNASGDTEFQGSITTSSGKIANWRIGVNSLFNDTILLDSASRFIGVRYSREKLPNEPSKDDFYASLKVSGGIAIMYSGTSEYGIEGWAPGVSRILPDGSIEKRPGKKIFSLGVENQIASWMIGEDALYMGSVRNTMGSYTRNSGDITIGTQGIRGYKWYVDADGEADFVDGLVHFGPSESKIAGWTLQPNKLTTPNCAIVSDPLYSGIFFCNETISGSENNTTVDKIKENGGIYFHVDSTHAELAAYQANETQLFKITSSGTSQIANWKIKENCLYVGNFLINQINYARYTGSLILKDSGIHATQWFLLSDGSGALAHGAISWDSNGNLKFGNSVSLEWSQITNTDAVTDKLTKIDANGIYTGEINADKITSGTLSADRLNVDEILSNGEKWALLQDGSGYLAGKKITWGVNGELSVEAKITSVEGEIGGFKITNEGLFTINSYQQPNYSEQHGPIGVFSLYSRGDSAFMCFHDEYRWAGIGLNAMPAGADAAVARFENKCQDSIYGWQANVAMVLHAQNGKRNYAYIGSGNGILNGWIQGYKIGFFDIVKDNTVIIDAIDLTVTNKWICKSTSTNGHIALPSLSDVGIALGLGATPTTPFCVEVSIICDVESNLFNIYGNGNILQDDIYPKIVTNKGAVQEYFTLSPGNCLQFLLVYNPNETGVIPRNSLKYTARLINRSVE